MTPELRTGTVLVIEEDRSLAELYSQFLESQFSVKTAFDGSQELEMMDDDVDVVLLDRRMPGLSGTEVIEELRTEFDRCQVAMVTAVDPNFDVIEIGFDEYIIKPVSKEELIELVVGACQLGLAHFEDRSERVNINRVQHECQLPTE